MAKAIVTEKHWNREALPFDVQRYYFFVIYVLHSKNVLTSRGVLIFVIYVLHSKNVTREEM